MVPANGLMSRAFPIDPIPPDLYLALVSMRTVIVIPARLAALRFPNKPLAALGGLPLVARVANQAKNLPGLMP